MTPTDEEVKRFGGFGIAMLRESPAREYVLASDHARIVSSLREEVTGLRRWQSAALSWLRADDSPSALALRRDADDPVLSALEKLE